MRRLFARYDDCLRARPLLTKCVTSSILFGVGDRLAQHIERRSLHTAAAEQEEHAAQDGLVLRRNAGSADDAFVDYEQQRRNDRAASMQSAQRTLRMMVWGGIGFAPLAHAWFNAIERVAPGKTAAAVVKKIALDQVFFAPFITATFFIATQTLEGKPMADALHVTKDKVPPTLRVNYMVWPLVHLFTFSFVPLQYRILWINFVSIGWSTFLSQMTNAPPSLEALDASKAPQSSSHGVLTASGTTPVLLRDENRE